jgi:DNA-binding CsgD family transcriptional regulator
MRNSPLRPVRSSVRSPGTHAADGSLSVDDLLITSELRTRRKRRRQELVKRSALQELSRRIGDDPSDVLRRFVELAMQLCGGGSAGISVYEPQSESAGIFRWHALTGRAARHNGETTPRDFSPCGICLDKGEIILMDRPGRYYGWLNLPEIPLTEALLVPLLKGTVPFGTLWIMSHDEHRFDAEDARILADMSSVVGLALKLISEIAAKDARLNDIEAAVRQSQQTESLKQLAIGVANDFHSIEVAKAVALVNSLRLRERQVLEGLMAGGTTKQIASELELSVRTVEVHRSHMLRHLGVRRVAMAVRLGVLAAVSVHGVIARPGNAHSPL